MHRYNNYDLDKIEEEFNSHPWDESENEYEPIYPCQVVANSKLHYSLFAEQQVFWYPKIVDYFKKQSLISYVRARSFFELAIIWVHPTEFEYSAKLEVHRFFDEAIEKHSLNTKINFHETPKPINRPLPNCHESNYPTIGNRNNSVA